MGDNFELTDIEELVAEYKKCSDNKKKRMLRLEIVQKGMRIVKKIANNIKTNISGEDIMQVGAIGLIKSIEFYDPNKNTKFRTYATYLIRGEIMHYLRDKASIVKAPRELQELVTTINSANKELKSKGFYEPTVSQLSEITGIKKEKISEVLDLSKNTISLDQSLTSSEDEDLTLIDKIPSGDYQEISDLNENKIMLSSAIDKLPDELKEIVELSFYNDLNQKEIGKRLNLSQMQVSRKLKKALNKMYEYIESQGDI